MCVNCRQTILTNAGAAKNDDAIIGALIRHGPKWGAAGIFAQLEERNGTMLEL